MPNKTELRTCSIDGCNRPYRARGLCNTHYMRWHTHGDPLGGRTSPGAPHKYLQEVVIPYTGNDCLVWPFGRTKWGYGGINIGGQKLEVHRVVCAEVNGSPPTAIHQAAHYCGNGHLGCVNPRHLRWATPRENSGDKIKHGTVGVGSAKLHPRDVHEILALRGKLSQARLADMYSVSQSAIAMIHSGKNWKSLAGRAALEQEERR